MSSGTVSTITVTSAAVQPPPIPKSGDKWARRVISQEVSVASSTSPEVTLVSPPTECIGGILDHVSVWGVGTQSMYVTLFQGAVSDLGSDEVVANDYSSLAQLPGVTFVIPEGHATELTSASVLKIERLTTSFKAIVHYHLWIRY